MVSLHITVMYYKDLHCHIVDNNMLIFDRIQKKKMKKICRRVTPYEVLKKRYGIGGIRIKLFF